MIPSESAVEVLYVLGHGRSGSTLLDIVLGNHPEIESTGEVTNLPTRGWMQDKPCSCGLSANECPFWSEVRKEWARRIGSDDVEGFLRLQDAFEQHRYAPRLLLERIWPSRAFKKYARLNVAFYEAIRAVSGKPVVVDSSKNPPRAFALSAVPGVDLRVVYVIRDARGVAASRKKGLKKDEKAGVLRDEEPVPVWRSSLRWLATNLLSEWIWRRVDPEGPRVRYEDLVADPRRELDRIGRHIGKNLTDVAHALLRGDEMRVDHVYGGNRMRMAGRIRLSSDAGSWMGRLSKREQSLCWALTGLLMKRHGYKK
jgi:hypothetical protein